MPQMRASAGLRRVGHLAQRPTDSVSTMRPILTGEERSRMTSVENADQPLQVAPRGLIARHPLTSFFVIAYAFSWLIEVPIALAAAGILPVTLPRPVLTIGIVAATFGPTDSASS